MTNAQGWVIILYGIIECLLSIYIAFTLTQILKHLRGEP